MTIMRQFTRCTFNMSVMFNRFKIAHCLFRTKASIFTRQTDTRTNDGIDTIVHKIPFECTQGQYLSKYAITFNKGNEIECILRVWLNITALPVSQLQLSINLLYRCFSPRQTVVQHCKCHSLLGHLYCQKFCFRPAFLTTYCQNVLWFESFISVATRRN